MGETKLKPVDAFINQTKEFNFWVEFLLVENLLSFCYRQKTFYLYYQLVAFKKYLKVLKQLLEIDFL